MKAVFEEDQRARQPTPGKDARQLDWEKTNRMDRDRRVEVLGYLLRGKLNSGEDLYRAAMVFQHGECAEHYKLASDLARKVAGLGYEPAKWLCAAALDRYLMTLGQPQKFGTQFRADGPGGKWYLYPVDPATTNEERRRYNVPTLAELRKQAEQMNAKSH